MRVSALLAIPDHHLIFLGFILLLKIAGLDLVISDACSCLTIPGSFSAYAGEGPGKGTEGRGGCGEETWSGMPVSCLQKTHLAASASILDRAPFSVTAPLLPIDPLFMCRWCGDSSMRVWLCDSSVERSVVGHSSVGVEGSCPLSGSGRDVGVPTVTGGILALPAAGMTLCSERTYPPA